MITALVCAIGFQAQTPFEIVKSILPKLGVVGPISRSKSDLDQPEVEVENLTVADGEKRKYAVAVFKADGRIISIVDPNHPHPAISQPLHRIDKGAQAYRVAETYLAALGATNWDLGWSDAKSGTDAFGFQVKVNGIAFLGHLRYEIAFDEATHRINRYFGLVHPVPPVNASTPKVKADEAHQTMANFWAKEMAGRPGHPPNAFVRSFSPMVLAYYKDDFAPVASLVWTQVFTIAHSSSKSKYEERFASLVDAETGELYPLMPH